MIRWAYTTEENCVLVAIANPEAVLALVKRFPKKTLEITKRFPHMGAEIAKAVPELAYEVYCELKDKPDIQKKIEDLFKLQDLPPNGP